MVQHRQPTPPYDSVEREGIIRQQLRKLLENPASFEDRVSVLAEHWLRDRQAGTGRGGQSTHELVEVES